MVYNNLVKEVLEMTIGERIKQRRTELGLSQEEVANKLGYKSRTSVFKVEQGITDLPLSKVKEFAKVLKTSPSYLMGWAEEENKDRFKVDTSMLTEAELAEFNKVTGVNKQLFFEDLDEEHDMAIFKQAIVEILLSKRKERKK